MNMRDANPRKYVASTGQPIDLTARLAKHALATRYEDLPLDVVEAARDRLVDTLSCTLGGAMAPGNSAMLELLRSWGGTPQATVLAHGDRLPLHNAALMNAMMCRSFDFEVTGPEADGINAGRMVGHVCATTEPLALAVAEHTHASGRELLTAVVIGGDIAARMAVAHEFDFDRNFEVCGTANAIGATALAARLMGLNEAQLVNALGIVLHLMGGSFQSLWDGVDSFKLPGAMAASNAVLAVEMARRGFGGVHDALESPQGYFAMFGNKPEPERAIADLGQLYYAKGMHKLHPSCYGNHNPIEAALEIVQQHRFAVEEIESVVLDVPPNRVRHFLNQPMDAEDGHVRALFSIPFAIANVLLRREVQIAHYTAPLMHDAQLIALTRKVKLEPNLPLGLNQASRLTVTLKDGRCFTSARQVPLGWLKNPVQPEQVRAKFWRNVAHAQHTLAAQGRSLDRGRVQQALAQLEQLETLGDVSPLPALLVAPMSATKG